VIGGVGGAISMVGDLAASAVKRNYEIKDYGTLIPGHGGIMDRFDSVIITAPLVYYLILLLQQVEYLRPNKFDFTCCVCGQTTTGEIMTEKDTHPFLDVIAYEVERSVLKTAE